MLPPRCGLEKGRVVFHQNGDESADPRITTPASTRLTVAANAIETAAPTKKEKTLRGSKTDRRHEATVSCKAT